MFIYSHYFSESHTPRRPHGVSAPIVSFRRSLLGGGLPVNSVCVKIGVIVFGGA